MMFRYACVATLLWGVCASAQDSAPSIDTAAQNINEAVFRGHVRFLADDLLEGRGPGSRGDAITQLYLSAQFQALGLQPAAADGTWFQPVPLVGVKTEAPAEIQFKSGDQSVTVQSGTDFMSTIGSPKTKASITDAELVFIGYGIQAPEYDWDDFKDVDLTGKILVVMNNDPSDDPELFAGRRRLYYGRWDYKYESAARQGAAGAIIIHTTPSAGYPWQVIQTSWAGEEFELRDAGGPRMELKAWATEDAARKIVACGGQDLDALRAAAETRDFRPVPLGVTLSVDLAAKVRTQDSANILARLPGSDPELADEHVIFMAHHDHLGMSAERDINGDNIYNGAVDNASGTAALLAIAKACVELNPRPARSVLFAAVAAEEQGLLGSKYFAADPPIPPGKLAAVINIDSTNVLGRTHDVNVIGKGKSSLDVHVEAVATSQGRVVTPDHFPDRGYYYRSDQFSLAKIGVPGVYLHSGINVVGKPDGWGKAQLDDWVEKVYHQPSDEYRDDWNLSGTIEDTRLLFEVGIRVANDAEMPFWNPGDEFEAARKEAIRQSASNQD
ncbi:Bacterial leucyl aminopeptidase precursor [Rubripirellula lacrimiformis]|uniref:Bacterial leucyl aminopeptidase n=1 Tax=Rubripirellula lacrimiformis TaxID=1930273 RepID=A0A517NA77_9BACT|nr:M28 family peptidase [Rubripirellula lacrimiformis]QDT04030.1 Bacterial leucyl aminopeptidase precursor [Rubripirellula lacrimiformis]